ncbi:MAG: C-type lectin domain-containing protein [Myxococcota bacterium]
MRVWFFAACLLPACFTDSMIETDREEAVGTATGTSSDSGGDTTGHAWVGTSSSGVGSSEDGEPDAESTSTTGAAEEAGDDEETTTGEPLDPCLEEGACPAGCLGKSFEARDYALCLSPLDHASARAACLAVQGELVRIETGEQNIFLADEMRKAAGTDTFSWIGASDSTTEGAWRWHDDETPFYVAGQGGDDFVVWGLNQPDDFLDTEDCGNLATNDGTWWDFDCGFDNPFICELP